MIEAKFLMQGPELVIHQSDAVLENMNEWSARMHAKTGLTNKCRKSKVTLKDAEDQVPPPPNHHHLCFSMSTV